jgi:hypothetical protein
MDNPVVVDTLLTAAEVAQQFQVNIEAVYLLIQQGNFAARELGRL